MRWGRLFEDFEAQWAARRQYAAEQDAVEDARLIQARTTMSARLIAHRAHAIRLALPHGRVLEGVVSDVGSGWVVMVQNAEQILIPLSAITWWEPVTAHSRELSEAKALLLGLGIALRALSRAHEPLRVIYAVGSREAECRGFIDAVGADYVELLVDGIGNHGTLRQKRMRRIFPMASIVAIASRRSEHNLG